MENATRHEVDYVPIANQTSRLVARGKSKLTIDFLDKTSKTPEDVSVWFVQVQTDNSGLDAVLKIFHKYGSGMEENSIQSAKKLSANTWKLWRLCDQAEERSAVLSAEGTAVVQLKGDILNLKDIDHRPGDPHPLRGKTVTGVLMRRLGKPLANFGHYTKFSEKEVINLLKTMGKVLDLFQQAELVHCDIKEQNIVHDPAEPSNYVLIDYCDIRSKSSTYLPLSIWCIPSFGFDRLRQRDYAIEALPAIDRLMLFFACIRLLAGNEDGTRNSSDLSKTFESIKDTNLKGLLLKPFEDVPKYEDDEPFAEYLLRRLRKALPQN